MADLNKPRFNLQQKKKNRKLCTFFNKRLSGIKFYNFNNLFQKIKNMVSYEIKF